MRDRRGGRPVSSGRPSRPRDNPRSRHSSRASEGQPAGFGRPARVAFPARETDTTILRVTLILVSENQNITLSVPRELLKRVKRLAADRETSVSALMMQALARLADEDRRYAAARKRALAALRSARSLGTGGRPTWTRGELHER